MTDGGPSQVKSAVGFGEQLRELRLARGLSQEQVARDLGIRILAYGRWERGQQQPGLRNRLAVARYFEVDPALLGVQRPAVSQADDVAALARIARLEHVVRDLQAELAELRDLFEERRGD